MLGKDDQHKNFALPPKHEGNGPIYLRRQGLYDLRFEISHLKYPGILVHIASNGLRGRGGLRGHGGL